METATIRIVGDIMLAGSVVEKIDNFGPSFPFERIVGKLEPSDIFFGNLECTLLGSDDPPIPKKILLQSNPAALKGLKYVGVNIVSLANNHSFDYGLEAYNTGRMLLKENGIKCVGGGNNLVEASQYTLLEVNDLRFGFLAYCASEAGCYQPATVSSNGVAPIDLDSIRKDLAQAKSQTDFVVVLLHWGKEFRDYPSPENVDIARSIIENGATIVAGAHAHVFQGYEKYKDGLIIYDLGSFVFGDILMETPIEYTYYLKKRKCKEGMIVDCMFDRTGLVNFKFTPHQINSDFQAVIPSSTVQQRIAKRFEKQSKWISRPNYALFYQAYLFKIRIVYRLLRSIKVWIGKFVRNVKNLLQRRGKK